MSTARFPTVFISSTCFDLGQVRTDLAHFLESQLGYRFLASEHASFPVEPDATTIENCRRRVEQDADVLVLIIGGRRGAVDPDTGRSFTNIEYLTARAKSIPIFVFARRDVLELLPIWQVNPSADFSSVVDSPQLFAFLSDVRSADARWTFPFLTAQEIIDQLRIQLAYMMSRGLGLLAHLRDSPADLWQLHGQVFRLAVERPPGWQPLLLIQALRDELANYRDQRRDYDLGLTFGVGEHVANAEAAQWFQRLLADTDHLWPSLETVINVSMNEALQHDDVGALVYVARRIVAGYANALNWSLRVRCAHVPTNWAAVRDALSRFLGSLLVETERMPDRLEALVMTELAKPADQRQPIEFTLKVAAHNLDELHAAMNAVKQ